MQPESPGFGLVFCVVWMILSSNLPLYIKCFLFEFSFSSEWIYYPGGRLGLTVLRRAGRRKSYRSRVFHVALSAEDWFMCVIYGKQRVSDTHPEFMGSGVTALAGLRKQIDTSMERGGGQGGARKGELVHTALLISLGK